MRTLAPPYCETVGFVLKDTKSEIVLFSTRGLAAQDGDINSIITIPREWAVKVTPLVPKAGARRRT